MSIVFCFLPSLPPSFPPLKTMDPPLEHIQCCSPPSEAEDDPPSPFSRFRQQEFVMNGRFKRLVSRLLISECVLISAAAAQTWLDIVTCLSWEAAASLITAAAAANNKIIIMDPQPHVKVKCIATGLCIHSQLIKGLVFNKNAAAHMLTTPKLLLLGGHTTTSSFHSMEQMCRPDVVFLEKSVSPDVQQSFLAKGITLVSDMNPYRLHRISSYTASQIFSSNDSFSTHKLKTCKSFYFEKIIEEHAIFREGGNKPIKTLMFLEGFDNALGCTILLKGAHNNELKKIKSVMLSAVVVAYHLILETFFLVDQIAMFSTVQTKVVSGFSKVQLPIVGTRTLQNATSLKESLAGAAFSLPMDVPISDGSGETPACEETSCFNMNSGKTSAPPGFNPNIDSYEKEIGQSKFIRHKLSDNVTGYQIGTSRDNAVPNVLTGDKVSLISVSLNDINVLLLSSATCLSSSTYFGDKNNGPDNQNIPALPLPVDSDQSIYCGVEVKDSADIVETPDSFDVPVELCKADVNDEIQMEIKDDYNTGLNSHSILYLVSTLSDSKRRTCKQSHLCRVKYYKNFDMSLGQLLHDILNQTHRCLDCGGPHEVHAYNYVNQCGRITVQVKHLPVESLLPGEAEGKLWMWAQCSKCKRMGKKQGSTQRVVMSTGARSISFGKYLELSFSVHSGFNGLSGCGHSLHKDYLRFYGLGPMVTIFTYSPVIMYTTCMPPPVLEFNNPTGQDYIKKEAESVLKKGMLLFNEVTDILRNIGSSICSSNSNPTMTLTNSVSKFSEVEEMLTHEKSDFEAKIGKITDKNHLGKQCVHELLKLNSLLQELMIESYVWDQRLQFLLASEYREVNTVASHKAMLKEVQLPQQKDGIDDQRVEGRATALQHVSDETTAILIDRSESNALLSVGDSDDSKPNTELEIKWDVVYTGKNEHSLQEFQISEHQCGSHLQKPGNLNSTIDASVDAQADGRLTMGASYVDERTLHNYPIAEGHLTDTDSVVSHSHASKFSEASSGFSFMGPERGISVSQNCLLSQGWVWNSFSEICKEYNMDLQEGYSQKFEYLHCYTPECLSLANKVITEEGYKLHIQLGHDDVVSAHEDEPASIIAYALAMLHGKPSSDEDIVKKKARKEKGDFERGIENASSLDSDISVASPYWSSNGSLDSEGIYSKGSVPLEETYSSFFDASSLVDPMLTVENSNLEMHYQCKKLPKKGKYSVVCFYEKQFRGIRSHCCPCELDYISSLSRSKKWDAKGGKSGALFVKTLDDRFIVKQIQKTELDSFLKFAPDYFSYIKQSLSSGSQTCLAKILGIYQVTIRQSKSGKDIKYDLMVMENLLFGRNITRLYDLKGAQYSRYTKDTDGAGKVFLDGNFVEDMNISPLYVSGKIKHLLQRAIWNDTHFLTSINVMDYSLLVGVDTQQLELVCGIIDYLRQYTWDKQLETWVKTSLVVPKNGTPTVISPKEYKKRFRKFMDSHFFSVPDCCCPEIAGRHACFRSTGVQEQIGSPHGEPTGSE